QTFSGFEAIQGFAGRKIFPPGFDRGIREPALWAIPAPIARGAGRREIPIAFLDFSTGCSTEKFPLVFAAGSSPVSGDCGREASTAIGFARGSNRPVHRSRSSLHLDWRE